MRRYLGRCMQHITKKCVHELRSSATPNAAAAYRQGGTSSLSTDVQAEKFELGTYWAAVSASVNMALDSAVAVCYPEKIHEAMRYSLLSAPPKMPCPLLCTAACHLTGGSTNQALPVACAVEMLHAATVAHDDLPCMDNVSTHRGQAASHAIYGEDVAILAGDALFGLAFQHIVEGSATQGVPAERVLSVLSEVARGMGSKGLVGGQYMDLIAAGNPSASIDPSLLEYIHLHKSALMAQISVVGGGIIGGGSHDDLERLRGYGRSVGLLYQIVEDMLHVDTVAVKATYPKVHGIEKSRLIVKELNVQAKEFLSPFAQKTAAPLLSFADYAATRSL